MENHRIPRKDTGRFIHRGDSFSTPLYTLKRPVYSLSQGFSFFVVYRSSEEAEGELHFTSGKILYFTLPSALNTLIHFQVPVSMGTGIKGFRIKERVKGGTESFKLFQCGLEKTGFGFVSRKTDGRSEIVLRKGMKQLSPFSFSFGALSKAAYGRFNQVQIGFQYSFSGKVSKRVSLYLSSKGKTISHRLIVRPGGSWIYFYSDEEGMIPESLAFFNTPPSFHIVKLEIKPFSRFVPVSYKPIPADLGVILGYKKSSWRRNDFEIFSWTLFPDFLILDFRDYALQSAFLKRIAFFLEKRGYAGRLLTNEELKGLHGWNAHDYRAEDLARFFNKAEETKFSLNPEEYLLADILLKNGILVKNGGRYIPVSGGFLAFTQESSKRLRYLFITHEGYHGVFFSCPKYRQAVKNIWAALSEDEKAFWMEFLGWKGYNINDPYLVVNEFQAYLMQQNIQRVNHYYKEYIIPQLDRFFPGKKEKMDRFLKKYPDHFIKSARAVQAAVSHIKGITAGELRCVVQ